MGAPIATLRVPGRLLRALLPRVGFVHRLESCLRSFVVGFVVKDSGLDPYYVTDLPMQLTNLG
jgi:hypothetical protein